MANQVMVGILERAVVARNIESLLHRRFRTALRRISMIVFAHLFPFRGKRVHGCLSKACPCPRSVRHHKGWRQDTHSHGSRHLVLPPIIGFSFYSSHVHTVDVSLSMSSTHVMVKATPVATRCLGWKGEFLLSIVHDGVFPSTIFKGVRNRVRFLIDPNV